MKTSISFDRTDEAVVNSIRTLSIDAIDRSNSGHPGLPMGAAPMAYVLWQKHLRFDSSQTSWPNRDRFILSAGHGSMLLYSLLHLYGYPLSLDEIKSFRKWGSKTPGHPESFMTPGVECTTGPLGQGAANAVGMAIAERTLAHAFNREGFPLIDHFTYALVSDGDLMEGVCSEAVSLAGHMGLGKLIYLYDSNDVTLDGPSSLAFSKEDTLKRFEASGWHVQIVTDGDRDLDSIDRAIENAKADLTRPSLILVKTTIGFGSPNKQGKSASHGSPLGAEETKAVKKAFGVDPEKSFFIEDSVKNRLQETIERGKKQKSAWEKMFQEYRKTHPDLAKEWDRRMKGTLPENWEENLPKFAAGDSFATRESAGKVLNSLAQNIPELMGGDADLSVSTSTSLVGMGDFHAESGRGRNFHFGVREHAMGSIANGIAYYGSHRIFTATFFCFADYMRPAIRLAAMNHLPVVFVFTHDSIGLGEDGPTHQPVEHLMAYRTIPGVVLLRPADANEARECWKIAIQRKEGPTILVLSRQKIKTLEETSKKMDLSSEVSQGAYLLSKEKSGALDVCLLATGSEVEIAFEVKKLLEQKSIHARIVSIPSFELFHAQSDEKKRNVLGEPRLKVSIEAGITFGWERWIGESGLAIGLDRFGASAPAPILYKELGFDPIQITDRILKMLSK